MPLQGEYGETQTVTVTLREFSLAIGLQQQGQMGKLWHGVLPAKGLVEQHMKRSTGQPLLTTDHVGDLHQMVIHDIRQMIGGQLIGTLIEHLVVKNVTLHAHLTTDEVVDQHLLSCLDLKANHILLAIGNQLIHLFLGKGQRIAHLTAGVAVVLEVLYLCTLSL